jgi:hypothetical protein
MIDGGDIVVQQIRVGLVEIDVDYWPATSERQPKKARRVDETETGRRSKPVPVCRGRG